MKTLLLITCIVALAASPVLAADKASAARGKELFNSSTLGTNGKSCDSCHAGGGKLGKSAAYDEAKLKKIINQCISMALKGKPLPSDSPDLASLALYLKTLAPASGR